MGGNFLGKQGFEKMQQCVELEQKQSNTRHDMKEAHSALDMRGYHQKNLCMK